MKRNNISKSALACLLTGLLMTTLTPAISRYLPLPDFLKGFLCGLGLMLELIALVKIQRSRRAKCAVSGITKNDNS